MKKISIEMGEGAIGFEEACDLAALAAARANGTGPADMRVVAWYDRRSKRSFPEVGFSEGPVVSWENSAESCGADVWVEMKGGSYIFLCGSPHRH